MKEPKRAQIQIGETVAVIFVFFVLIVIAFLFYARIIKSNASVESGESSQLASISISQRVMFLPEIQCNQGNVEEISNCVDLLKLEPAQDTMKKNQLYYYDFFQFSEINLSQVYPQGATYTLYSKKMENFRDKFVTNVPISLYDSTARTYSFGVLTIETYLK